MILDKDSQKKVVLLCLLAFFTLSFCGVAHFGMTMNPDGTMSDCPFMGLTSVCKMSPMEHIVAWQNMFVSLPLNNIAILFSFLMLASIAIFYSKSRSINGSPPLSYMFLKEKRFVAPNFLQDAFSRGILNSKYF